MADGTQLPVAAAVELPGIPDTVASLLADGSPEPFAAQPGHIEGSINLVPMPMRAAGEGRTSTATPSHAPQIHETPG